MAKGQLHNGSQSFLSISARLWRLPPKGANMHHKLPRDGADEEFYSALEGTGRLRVGDETYIVPSRRLVTASPG